MSVGVYNDTQTLTIYREFTLSTNLGAGSISIEMRVGGSFVQLVNITANQKYILGGPGSTYRIAPSGGAVYEIN